MQKKATKKKSKAGKIVLICFLVFLAAAVLTIGGTIYVSSSHYDTETGLEYKISPSDLTCRIVGIGKCTDEEITVPEKIGPYTVTEISGSAFARVDNLKKIEIPETVTKIDVSAFYESRNLEEVILPSGITEIASSTFFGCKSLEKIELPESIVKIGENAFEESGITEIDIGKNVKHIGRWAFAECYELKHVEIPGTVEVIEQGALSNCDNLESVIFGEGIEEIPESMFFSAVSLEEVVFPKSIKRIGREVFSNGIPAKLVYLGTVAEWNAVEKADDWSRYVVIRCTDGAVDIYGNPVTE